MSEAVVVDTDVLSYAFKGDSRFEPFRSDLEGAILVVSFMTVAELERWALQREWGAERRQRLETFLGRLTLALVDRRLCRMWALISDRARRAGRPIPPGDAWIAATALSLGLPLLTNNRADFSGVEGLRLRPDR